MSDLINRKDVMQIFVTALRGDIPYAIMGGLIKGLPSIESLSAEPCKSTDQNVADVPSDLISRDDAIDVVCKELQFQEENRNEPYDNGTCFGLKTARELLLALPSADRPSENFCRDCPIYSADRPQVNSNSAEEQIAETCDRPKGEWIIRDDMPKLDNTYSIECSECGQLMFGHYNADNPNYCPNCGADMRPEK